jgi:hypothetical protein
MSSRLLCSGRQHDSTNSKLQKNEQLNKINRAYTSNIFVQALSTDDVFAEFGDPGGLKFEFLVLFGDSAGSR